MGRRRWARAAAAGCTVAGGAAGAAYVLHPGVRRSMQFWTQAVPIALHYHAVDGWDHWRGASDAERSARLSALHELYAPRVLILVLELRGFFIKVAQMASARDDLLADEYLKFFKTLQDAVPTTMPCEDVVRMVEDELGQRIGDMYDEFADKPCGSATIGQVHLATLPGGRKVAVKVQYPGAEDSFRRDVGLCLTFCRVFMRQHVPVMEEFRRQFDSEFDFRLEGAQLSEMSGRVRRGRLRGRAFVPDCVAGLTTRRVLTMDAVPGTKLVDGLREMSAREAARLGEDPKAYEERMKGVAPPSRWYMATVAAALRALDLLHNLPVMLWNATAGACVARWRRELRRTEAPINIRAVLDAVSEVHAWQLFDEGMYNADPHPGNIILMPDGRLGLIDWGQCGRLSVPDRAAFAALLGHLRDRAAADVIAADLEQMGYRFSRRDTDTMLRYARFHFEKEWTNHDVVMGMNPLAFMDWLHAQDPILDLPQAFILVDRMLLVLSGFRNAFGLPCNMAEELAPHADAWLAKHAGATAA